MKKTRQFLIGVVLLLVLLCGAAAVQAEADWTVLLYLCGTDLETKYGEATQILTEVGRTKPNASVNFVIETGGTKEWHSQNGLGFRIANHALQRYQYDINGYTLIEEVPSASMGKPNTLRDFIRWGTAAYPAKNYMLVLWDHGGGTYIFYDEIYNDSMQSYEIGEAMRAAGVQFEIIMIDACQMSNLETASAVASNAHYMVASEELAYGSSFTLWLQSLYDASYMDGIHFSRYICDTTQQEMDRVTSRTLTWAVTDLTKIDAVKTAFADFVREMAALLTDAAKYSKFDLLTNGAESYGTYKFMVDLGDFANRARNSGISNKTIFTLMNAIADAVVYQVKGYGRSYAHGLSFFYNRAANPMELDAYVKNCPVPEYLAFLDAINPDWDYTGGSVAYDEVDPAQYTIETSVSCQDNGAHLQLDITSGKNAVSTVDYNLMQYVESQNIYLSMGMSFDVKSNFKTGVILDNWPDSWIGYNHIFFETDLVEETDVYTLYNVPVIIYEQYEDYNPYAEITQENISYLRIGYFHDSSSDNPMYNNRYIIYGILDGTYLEGNERSISSLVYQGSYMSIVRRVYSVNEKGLMFDSYEQSTPFQITQSFTVMKYSLQEGTYAFIYQVKDVFGRRIQAAPMIAEYEQGRVYFHALNLRHSRDSKNAVPMTMDRIYILE